METNNHDKFGSPSVSKETEQGILSNVENIFQMIELNLQNYFVRDVY